MTETVFQKGDLIWVIAPNGKAVLGTYKGIYSYNKEYHTVKLPISSIMSTTKRMKLKYFIPYNDLADEYYLID